MSCNSECARGCGSGWCSSLWQWLCRALLRCVCPLHVCRAVAPTCWNPISRASRPTCCSCCGKMAACLSTTATLTMPAGGREGRHAGRNSTAVGRRIECCITVCEDQCWLLVSITTFINIPADCQQLCGTRLPPTRIQHLLQVPPQGLQIGCPPHADRLPGDCPGCHALQRVPLAVAHWVLAGPPV